MATVPRTKMKVKIPTLAAKNAARVGHPARKSRSLDFASPLLRKGNAALGMTDKKSADKKSNEAGRFGVYGGRYVPETLMAALEELEREYERAKRDPKFQKRLEELLQTGAHKINNCLGQALLVERMGKRRVIEETGAGQHGVATATVCALLGFECVVYMGTEDMRRQELNVFRMRLLGAEVRGVDAGSRTLKDAINEAMRDWVTNVRTTHYL